MTESDARRIALVRAFETPSAPPWSDADAAWASGEARRIVGERTSDEAFLSQRASLALGRLGERDASVAAAWQAAGGHAGIAALIVLIGFVAGLAGDAIGAAGRVNILAPPLLALLVWNLAVYAVLLAAALRARGRDVHADGPLRRALVGSVSRAAAAMSRLDKDRSPAPARFLLDWAGTSRSLQGARVAATLHAAAAALAIGALCSLYLRGLAFEYRAGWDSTFLSAASVHQLISLVLGPASQWSGISLPGIDELAALRFSTGGGENAARWIHLHAMTIGGLVVLPRLVLAAAAAWRARRLSHDFPLPLQDAYFRRLLRAHAGTPLAVDVLPYSYHLPADAVPSLREALERELGRDVQPALADPVPLGGEDNLAQHLPARSAPSATVAALFSLTATPERETHGAFVRALAQAVPDRERLMVLVDESGFRRRFADDTRLAQRREAWQRMLHDEGRDAVFVDLAEKTP